MNTRKDNPRPKQTRFVMTRKIARNMFKKRTGSNRIKWGWNDIQKNGGWKRLFRAS